MLVVAPAGAAEAEPSGRQRPRTPVPPEPRPAKAPGPTRPEAFPRPPSAHCRPRRLAVVAPAVDVVALAELAVDLLAGHVARVAHALPARCKSPSSRADDGAVVLAAAALQLLAAPAVRLALAVLPDVAGVAPAGTRGQRPPGRTLLPRAGAGAGGARPHRQTPHSIEPLPPQTLRSLLPGIGTRTGEGTRTVTVSVKPSARMVKDCSWMHSVAAGTHLEGDLSWERRAPVSTGPQGHDPTSDLLWAAWTRAQPRRGRATALCCQAGGVD